MHRSPVQVQSKAHQMVIKHILEGARRFEPVESDPNAQPGAQAQRAQWRWPEWSRWTAGRKDKYLIGIRPLRLPRV
jgi:hypothetical protein